MSRSSAPAEQQPWWSRVGHGMRDTGRRNIYLSALAIPAHLAMAGWKGALLLFGLSLFMIANVVFTVGLAAIKLLVVVCDRRMRRRGDLDAPRTAYRLSGATVLGLSLVFVLCCVPLVTGAARSPQYEQPVAIAIATVAFAELGFSLHGFFSSRRRSDLLMEAVKLSNLAASLILIVLTQTALLSFSESGDQSLANGICGLAMGGGASLIGLYMLVRPLSRVPSHTAGSETAPSAADGDVLRSA